MAAKQIAIFLLFAAFTTSAKVIRYFGQLSNIDLGPCSIMECDRTTKEPYRCDRIWTVKGDRKNDTIYLKSNSKDYFDIVAANGTLTGKTLVFEDHCTVIKLTARDEKGHIFKIACATTTQKPSDDDKRILKEHCNEKGLIPLDNSKCS